MSFECTKCGLKFSDPTLMPDACPNCGESLASGAGPTNSPIAAGLDPIRRYFATVWMILTQPTKFFRSMPLEGGVTGPLAFALITHWVGSAVAFLWRLVVGGSFMSYFDHFVRVAGDVAEVDNPGRNAQLIEMTDRVKQWVLGAGSVLIDPFTTLLQILFTSFLVFVGARLLVTPGKKGAPKVITYESALRVVCYGLTPSILAVLPLFGSLIAYGYRVVVTIIAARETYRIGSTRAAMVAFFPQVLLLGVVVLILVAIAVAILKFFTLAF